MVKKLNKIKININIINTHIYIYIYYKVLKHSDTGLTFMLADKEYKRLFVSNRSGNVYIYSISSINPELLATV
jgi:hypothetical protein